METADLSTQDPEVSAVDGATAAGEGADLGAEAQKPDAAQEAPEGDQAAEGEKAAGQGEDGAQGEASIADDFLKSLEKPEPAAPAKVAAEQPEAKQQQPTGRDNFDLFTNSPWSQAIAEHNQLAEQKAQIETEIAKKRDNGEDVLAESLQLHDINRKLQESQPKIEQAWQESRAEDLNRAKTQVLDLFVQRLPEVASQRIQQMPRAKAAPARIQQGLQVVLQSLMATGEYARSGMGKMTPDQLERALVERAAKIGIIRVGDLGEKKASAAQPRKSTAAPIKAAGGAPTAAASSSYKGESIPAGVPPEVYKDLRENVGWSREQVLRVYQKRGTLPGMS